MILGGLTPISYPNQRLLFLLTPLNKLNYARCIQIFLNRCVPYNLYTMSRRNIFWITPSTRPKPRYVIMSQSTKGRCPAAGFTGWDPVAFPIESLTRSCWAPSHTAATSELMDAAQGPRPIRLSGPRRRWPRPAGPACHGQRRRATPAAPAAVTGTTIGHSSLVGRASPGSHHASLSVSQSCQ
jgi:hypothetical protein